MPAILKCDSVHEQGSVRQIVFSLMRKQPNYGYFKMEPEVLRDIFNGEVREGDTWALQATLVSRVGTNGQKPSPLSEKI